MTMIYTPTLISQPSRPTLVRRVLSSIKLACQGFKAFPDREVDRCAVEYVTVISQPGIEARGEAWLAPGLNAWESALEGQGRSSEHVRSTARRARDLFAIPGLTTLGELERWTDIDGAMTQLEHLTANTRKAYIQSGKQFALWMSRRGKLAGDTPLLSYRVGAVREGDQRQAHALPRESDVQLLMDLDLTLPVRCGMTAEQRRLAYRLFVCTGIRVKELQALEKRGLTSRGLVLAATETKNRKTAHLPLPTWLYEEVSRYCSSLPSPQSKLFPGKGRVRGGEMMRADLEDMGADLAYYTEILSPHSLRVYFVTQLAKNSDVSFRQTMALARHSNPSLTAQVYARAGAPELEAAVEETFKGTS